MAQLAQKRKLLKKKKLRNIILNTVCLVIAGSGLVGYRNGVCHNPACNNA